ncbi:MAG TPA: TolC family protein, partial [Rubricoccaceae bacterium]
QAPDTLSEASAVERALAVSPALRTAEAAVALAQAERDADGAFFTGGPELDVDAALNPLEPPPPGDVEAGVSVSQTLERPAVRRARRAAAGSRLAVAEGQRRAARFDLVADVRVAVADLAAAQGAARLAREALVAADTLVSVARLRYRFGDVSELDWRLARADAAAVAAEVSRTEAERTAAEAALARLLAVPGARVAVPALDALPPVPVDTLAPAFRPDVEVAGLAARAAGFEAELGRERARFPTFTVRAGLERRALFYGADDVDGADFGDDFSLGRRETEVTLGLSVPLPFGGAGRREARRAEATAQLRAAESTEVQAGAASEVAASVAAVRESSRALTRLENVAADLREIDGLLALASSGGEIDVPTLLAQRDRVRGVRRAALEALATDRRARLALARALGRPAAGLPVDPE